MPDAVSRTAEQLKSDPFFDAGRTRWPPVIVTIIHGRRRTPEFHRLNEPGPAKVIFRQRT